MSQSVPLAVTYNLTILMQSEGKLEKKPSLNQILYEVTSEKITELQRQKDVLDRHYSGVLEKADACHDLVQEIETLYQGIKEAPVHHKKYVDMECARLFIENVAKDSSTKREKTIKELEKRVFEAGHINSNAYKAFLDKNFDKKNVAGELALDTIREDMEFFCEQLLRTTVSVSGLKDCVEGLLGCDLLNLEKQATLRQLKESDPHLEDLATLLSSRIKAVRYWNWPEKGVYVDVRRSIERRYRAFLDEDIITALFLQYIGAQFAVCMKKENGNPKNATVNIKNSLIHLLATEAQLHKVIKPEKPFTVVRTDMEWFGPSIEHESIKIVLQFLGVTDVWVDFMMRFLNVPMTFQKDASNDVRIRRRGVPIAHQLSALFGECILFMMESAVQHQTGIRLYRVHDDFWFWDSDQDK
ncbi:hypothetical protein INT44_007761 [Umbelopsis vinacea]|uniref:Reverse transcriptase domain-containing protein n=1 Tax=Umbelopsis vinacea TaxID=44442 RepID=A0A8H7PK12_9FUNG|nr:hypothetical protein INT44_007761 [Umbelopsis vinacea]